MVAEIKYLPNKTTKRAIGVAWKGKRRPHTPPLRVCGQKVIAWSQALNDTPRNDEAQMATRELKMRQTKPRPTTPRQMNHAKRQYNTTGTREMGDALTEWPCEPHTRCSGPVKRNRPPPETITRRNPRRRRAERNPHEPHIRYGGCVVLYKLSPCHNQQNEDPRKEPPVEMTTPRETKTNNATRQNNECRTKTANDDPPNKTANEKARRKSTEPDEPHTAWFSSEPGTPTNLLIKTREREPRSETGPDHTPAAAGVWSSKISLPLNEYMPENPPTRLSPVRKTDGGRQPQPVQTTHNGEPPSPAPQMATNEPGEPPSEPPRQQCPVPHTPLSGGVWYRRLSCNRYRPRHPPPFENRPNPMKRRKAPHTR
ncbi:hypothetical protein BS47DRAFT_1360267 [Hydnum rufescens UP504]|uniref:Uncharacterized protein n=1 Tax=Hydnum rufescens UP504 TaxID=1448309 RepID=A0A9P6B2D6_9AGAM|nr:hypothetical protein BS47DRAFT_1360267 [Hydnum rufescens UP504]